MGHSISNTSPVLSCTIHMLPLPNNAALWSPHTPSSIHRKIKTHQTAKKSQKNTSLSHIINACMRRKYIGKETTQTPNKVNYTKPRYHRLF